MIAILTDFLSSQKIVRAIFLKNKGNNFHILLGEEIVSVHISILNLMTSAAAAAAKSLQSCPTLCDPIDGSPSGSPVPRILQARTLEWVAISFSNA